jgi:hypothetical protein
MFFCNVMNHEIRFDQVKYKEIDQVVLKRNILRVYIKGLLLNKEVC